MDRRAFLATSSLAALGFAAGGCAARRPAATTRPARRCAWRASTCPGTASSGPRSVFGPHRDSRVRAPRRSSRRQDADPQLRARRRGHVDLLGHGRDGRRPRARARARGKRPSSVAASPGLTAARQLQRRGFDVTIYARAVPPDVTSSMSLAGWTPRPAWSSRTVAPPEWDAQFRQAAEIAYRQLQLLAGAGYGVSWMNQFEPVEEVRPPQPPPGARPNLQEGLQGGQEILQPGEHPFPTRFAIQRTTMRIEPSIYLPALMRDVVLFGGRIVVRKFETPRDLMALPEAVIVNCTGLGAYDLFGDKELVPVKGQLTVLVPQAEVDYQTSGGINLPSTPGIGIHMMPRADGIALGGTAPARGVDARAGPCRAAARRRRPHPAVLADEGVNRDTATDRPIRRPASARVLRPPRHRLSIAPRGQAACPRRHHPDGDGRFGRSACAPVRPLPRRSTERSHLALFHRTIGDIESYLLEQDIMFVAGGNTANMLAIWRAHGVDRALRVALEAGSS